MPRGTRHAEIRQRSADVTLLTQRPCARPSGPPRRNPLGPYDAVMSNLMPPDSPFESGAPYWYWLGGRPALDFVNSRRERWRRNVECLVSDDDVIEWLAAAGLLAVGGSMPRGLLDDARELREAIDAGVRAVAARRPMPREELRLIDSWLVLAGTRPTLTVGADGLPRLGERRATDSPRRALALIALDAAQMLGDGGRALARANLRVRHLLGAVLRPLAGRSPALVLDGDVRQRPPRPGVTGPVFSPLRRHTHDRRSPVRPRGRGRLRHRDRRARPGRRRSALPRRGHRGPRRPRALREGLGPARRRHAGAGPAAGRAAPAGDPLRRPARGRAGGAGDPRAGVGLRAADRHLRRAGP